MRGAAETVTVGVCPVGNHEAAKPVTTDRAAVEDATTRGEAPTIVNRGAGARTTTVVVVVADSLGTNRAGVAADRAAVGVDVAAIVAAGRTEAVGVDAVAIPEGDIPPMPRATIAAAIRLAAATSQRVTNSLPAVVAMPGASNHGVDTDDLVDATPRTSRRALPTEEGNGRTPLPPGASPLFWNWTSTTAGA